MSWLHNNSSRRMSTADLTVDQAAHPDWISAVERTPVPGEQVYCASGVAEVVKVLGKTGDGSRLLELKLPDVASKPFFAAASNVLVAPAAPSLC
ncbi:MAG TPA: hypothetical protein VFR81_10290 [Longimicrobium sp.]|nr:hypothetical protein [Longimicrobium sp.]